MPSYFPGLSLLSNRKTTQSQDADSVERIDVVIAGSGCHGRLFTRVSLPALPVGCVRGEPHRLYDPIRDVLFVQEQDSSSKVISGRELEFA